MANEDTALREVDQELAEERQWAMFRKYGPLAISAAIAIVAGVGGWQFWNARQDGIAQRQALEFRNAIELLSENEADGRTALKAIADEKASGYSTLAALQRAASFSRNGERLAAIEAYRAIYNDGATSKHLRDLARIRAGYLSLSDGREAVMEDIGDLAQSGGAYAFHAQEVSGLAALEAKDYETALSLFRRLSVDLGAPAPIRERAEDFAALAASGKAGVNITGETQLDDVLSIIGDGVNSGASNPGDHDNHDHVESEGHDHDIGETNAADGAEAAIEASDADPVTGGKQDDSNSENSENE